MQVEGIASAFAKSSQVHLQTHDKRSFAGVKHSTKAFLRMTLNKKHCMQGSRKSKLKVDLILEHCAIISMLRHRIYRNLFLYMSSWAIDVEFKWAVLLSVVGWDAYSTEQSSMHLSSRWSYVATLRK